VDECSDIRVFSVVKVTAREEMSYVFTVYKDLTIDQAAAPSDIRR